ncbi:MAG: diacylglycerol kinase family protein [Oscillospiraceae bacterium]
MKNNLDSLLGSFRFAFTGLMHTIAHERNMRVHIVAMIYVLLFSVFYNLSTAEHGMLYIVIAMVLITELFNTSIEAIVNLLSPKYSQFAKIAKDTAAASVLIAAIASVAVGICLFADVKVLHEIWLYFTQSIIRIVLLGLSVIIAVFFILSDIKK